MKKIFLFLSAVLVSLAMQATVVTKNFDLSGTKSYGTATVSGGTIEDAAGWNGAQLWQWTEGALAYDHVVLEVNNHDYPILLKVTYSGSPEDIAEQIVMPAANNSVAIEITHDIIKGIAVLNWSENTNVDITITGLYMRGAIGEKKDPVTLWDNGQTFGEWNAWDDRIQLPASLFDDLHAGDILEVNYTPDAQSYHQYKILLDYSTSTALDFLSGIVDEYQQININTTTNPSQMRFPIISETDVTNIKNQGGLSIHGKYLTINSVKLIRHDVLWSGSKSEDWSAIEVPASSFSSVTVGDILNIRLTAAEIGTQVELLKGNWGKFTPHLWYYFKEAPESLPTTIQFVLNQSMVDDLQANGLIARGATNFTITDIYIDAETATTTSYNLTVTAGMATLVLPFKVQSLPEGVEAYTLSLRESDHAIMAEQVDVIEADKPVLIVAEARATPYTFESELGGDANISGKAGIYRNEALVGTYTTIDPLAQQTGGNYNYILQKHGDEAPAFYQVQDEPCSVAPYRAYLSIAYDKANDNGGSSSAPARMRIVFHKDAPTGVESVQPSEISYQKILRNGQLFILRNGVEYNVNGQMTK